MALYPQDYKIQDQRVWPYPNKITMGGKVAYLTQKLKLSHVKGDGHSNIDQIVVNEFNDFVFGKTSFGGFNTTPMYQIQIKTNQLHGHGSTIDESYTLDVDEHGLININARSYVGAVHALATLSQLIRKKDNRFIIENVPLHIEDQPGVAFREVMLDCSRHFLPVDFIKKQIRAMAFEKLNVLHLHLTDGQSFPLALDPVKKDSKDYKSIMVDGKQTSYTKTIALGTKPPHEGNIGAFSPKEIYTSADIGEIVDYAKSYGIIVVPEIDTPGHSYSWSCGFPNIMTCDAAKNQTDWCCPEPPCGFFNIQDKFEQIKPIVKGVFLEVFEAFKLGQIGYGQYVHLGFDEVTCPTKTGSDEGGSCTSPSCPEAYGVNSEQYLEFLLEWFEASEPQKSITPIIWIDQILASNFGSDGKTYTDNIKHLNPNNIILQFWTLDDPNAASQIKIMADHGYRIINTQAYNYYLDAGGQGNSFIVGGPIIGTNESARPDAATYSYSYQKNWITAYPGIGQIDRDKCKTDKCNTDDYIQLNKGWDISFEDIYLNNITYLPTNARKPLVNGKIPYVTIELSTPSNHGGIIGAAVALWGEQVDETNLEQKLWPKASAFAESMWKFDPNCIPDNILNAKYRLIFNREDLLRLGVQASPLVPGDVFRKTPWGSLGGNNNLMHDVNKKGRGSQQIPEGYLFTYYSHWYAPFCLDKANNIYPINPFCGPKLSKYLKCDGTKETSEYFIQQSCQNKTE